MSIHDQTIKLLIVDDDQLTREGLTAGLSADQQFIIQEAGDGFAAIKCFNGERPDVVLLDLKMPLMNGIETMKEMKKIDRTVPIVIMTAYGDIPTAVEAMKYGAYDFTVKPPDMHLLFTILKKAGRLPKEKEGSDRSTGFGASDGLLRQRYDSLTSREREIFRMTVHGLSSMDISERLSISVRTVETHRGNLMNKLHARNRADLVLDATRLGIVR